MGSKDTVIFADQLINTPVSTMLRCQGSSVVSMKHGDLEAKEIIASAEAEVAEIQERFQSGLRNATAGEALQQVSYRYLGSANEACIQNDDGKRLKRQEERSRRR